MYTISIMYYIWYVQTKKLKKRPKPPPPTGIRLVAKHKRVLELIDEYRASNKLFSNSNM